MLTAYQDYNHHIIQSLSSKPVSPLKKVKCKVGYGESVAERDDLDGLVPQAKMKKLCLLDGNDGVRGLGEAKNGKDVSMAES